MEHRTDDWVQLINGGRFDLEGHHDLRGLTVHDVARSLSQITRFRGASNFPINVAQHSVLVSRLAEDFGGALAGMYGLAHDAHEIIVSDIPSPVKGYLHLKAAGFSSALRSLELRAECALWPLFGILWPMPGHVAEHVKRADMIALATERRDGLASVFEWRNLPDPSPRHVVLYENRQFSEAGFLSRFAELRRKLGE